jgi:hypothetical protein
MVTKAVASQGDTRETTAAIRLVHPNIGAVINHRFQETPMEPQSLLDLYTRAPVLWAEVMRVLSVAGRGHRLCGIHRTRYSGRVHRVVNTHIAPA